MTSDFSPAMLKFFLHARVHHMANTAFPASRSAQERGAKSELRKAAGVTDFEFRMAWSGRLRRPLPRLKIWMSLGIDPSVFGVRLIEDGEQEIVS